MWGLYRRFLAVFDDLMRRSPNPPNLHHIIPLSPSGDSMLSNSSATHTLQPYPKPATYPQFSSLCGPFNRKWFTDKLTEALLKAGLKPTTYSGHSFRRGAANTEIAAGIPKDEIKAMGHWTASLHTTHMKLECQR